MTAFSSLHEGVVSLSKTNTKIQRQIYNTHTIDAYQPPNPPPPLCPFDLLRQNNTFVAKICRFRRKNHRRYHARLPANDLLCLLSGEGGDPTSIQFLQLSLGPQGPHGIPLSVSWSIRLQEKSDHLFKASLSPLSHPNPQSPPLPSYLINPI